MKNYFPERFSELISNSDLTYEEIAKKLGFKSKGTISKYASGKIKKIEISMINEIADFFDVSPIWLLGYTNNKHFVIKE